MILASVFRFCVLIAGCFVGESGRRKVPSLAVIAVEPAPVALLGSSGIWITKNRYSKDCSLLGQTRVLLRFACSTEGYCRGH
jgi:hypothetical protein